MGRRLTTIFYRPVVQSELEAIRASECRAFPPRDPSQRMFCPLLSEHDAIRIARDWHTRDERCGYIGYVVRFRVPGRYAKRFEVNALGREDAREYWVPSNDLGDFNSHIDGRIEVIHEFRGPKASR